MKLLIVATYPPDQQYSLSGFANALLTGLKHHGVETRLIAPAVIACRTNNAASGIGKWLGHLDKLVFFPMQLRRAAKWADVVHLVDHGLAIYTRHLQNKPHLVTCNDLIAMRAARGDLPEWAASGTASIFQTMILEGLNRCQHVVCISQATCSDLLRLTDVREDRTTVVPDSLFHDFQAMARAEFEPVLNKLGLEDGCKFLLHIGRNVPTKNRIGVLEIFEELRNRFSRRDLHLVMAGKPLSPDLQGWVQQYELGAVVHVLPNLEADEIRALYCSAQALVFPSFYEGFGLPIIEAQACACPVFTSNRAPMTEVGGKAAVYFDPAQPAIAAQIIAEHLQSPEKLNDMREAGLNNVKRFNPDEMFRGYIKVYNRVLEEAVIKS